MLYALFPVTTLLFLDSVPDLALSFGSTATDTATAPHGNKASHLGRDTLDEIAEKEKFFKVKAFVVSLGLS